MTWRDNLRAASSEDGFIIAGGSGASLIPQNTNWHDNYMNSFTEDGIKIANLKSAVNKVSALPATGDTSVLYFLDSDEDPGMYYYDGEEWATVGGGGSYVLPIASADTLGGIKIGNGLSIDGGGVLSVAGGGGPTVVQTIGDSTTDVMSQNAVSSLIYADPTSQGKIWISSDSRRADSQYGSICIGPDAYCSSGGSVSIGNAAWPGNGPDNVAIGSGAQNNNFSYGTSGVILLGWTARLNGSSNYSGSAAIGAYSGGNVTGRGMVDFGSSSTNFGYNSTNYRLLTGVHDGQNAHDVATVGQISQLLTVLNSAFGTSLTISNGVISDGNANNANNNSGSVIAPTVTCPFCGQETDAASTICQNCGSDMTSTPYDPGTGEEPGPEIPVDNGEEPVVPGDEPGPEDAEAPMEG